VLGESRGENVFGIDVAANPLDYRHIDPLKIDFTASTEVMSSAYATRFGILPVQVNAHREVVIATAEPFMREWEKEMRRSCARTSAG
jgi:hypothetical protein